jgi:hypothetical protein
MQNGLKFLMVSLYVVCHIMRNRGMQHLILDKVLVTFRRLFGSGSGNNRHEEATLIGPPSATVGVSLPSGGWKKKDS